MIFGEEPATSLVGRVEAPVDPALDCARFFAAGFGQLPATLRVAPGDCCEAMRFLRLIVNPLRGLAHFLRKISRFPQNAAERRLRIGR